MAEIKVTAHVRLYQRKSAFPRAECTYLHSYVNMDSRFQEQILKIDIRILNLRRLLSSCELNEFCVEEFVVFLVINYLTYVVFTFHSTNFQLKVYYPMEV